MSTLLAYPNAKRVGLIADTHDSSRWIDKAIALFNQQHLDIVLHAGDVTSLLALKRFDALSTAFVCVQGNCDEGAILMPNTGFCVPGKIASLDLGGRKTILIHDLTHIASPSTLGAEVVVCGHTHRVMAERTPGGVLCLNPGEGCGRKYGRPTVGILTLETLQMEVLEL